MAERTTIRILWLISTMVMQIVSTSRPNVLFLVADDMRPELGSYIGPDCPSPVHPTIHTPNLDALARRSLLLKRAYVQQAVCSPSRTSLLTGRRPDTTHVYDLVTYFRNVGGNFTTLPQHFKNHGYFTVGMGKIFHPGAASHHDDPISWSEPFWHAPSSVWFGNYENSWYSVEPEVEKLFPLPDSLIAQHAVETLSKLGVRTRQTKQPFFLAVGFHKPHLPFLFPSKFAELYPPEVIRLPDNGYAPQNMPDIAWNVYGELLRFTDIAELNATGEINTTLPDKVVKDLRRAYYSSTSYIDSLFGEVISKLDAEGLANNTIVSFWGDHGWQLGEHGEWSKCTNFEVVTHAPMMIHIPGVTDEGIVTEKLTEFVDLFPTLSEAASLPIPPICPQNSTNVSLCTEGNSLIPLIRNPKRNDWKTRVFSQYPRPGSNMGYSMRTERYRYTEWVHFRKRPYYTPDWTKVAGIELYDHSVDPEENMNQAYNPAYKVLVKGLSNLLHHGWRSYK